MKNVLKIMEISEARAFTLHLPSSIYPWQQEQRSRNLDSSRERFMNPTDPNNTMKHHVIRFDKKPCSVQKEEFL